MAKRRSSRYSNINNGLRYVRVTRSLARNKSEKLVELSREGVEVVQKENDVDDQNSQNDEEDESKGKEVDCDVQEIRFIIDNEDLSDTGEDSLSEKQ
ncbi:3909_t:CDS:2 [Diversispora eburnea]|uniref:3909_t:CDS:1 n=1 Tax=Diversispora eburnea TaxID=1213867 RepID=A0A9N8ZSE6_9GLOM|nr:3909_t:CDS:2 [Diversispora eburnea]